MTKPEPNLSVFLPNTQENFDALINLGNIKAGVTRRHSKYLRVSLPNKAAYYADSCAEHAVHINVPILMQLLMLPTITSMVYLLAAENLIAPNHPSMELIDGHSINMS